MTIISVEGFIDTHVHTGPAPFRRIGDTIDVARWCREAKMSAIVIKSHFDHIAWQVGKLVLVMRNARLPVRKLHYTLL